MLIKTVKLPLLLVIICWFASLLVGGMPAQADTLPETMLWEMRPNESLTELAAKFYPKSTAMQRVFITKTQQLNKDTQVYASANTRYPIATQIVIPTLKSLSVRAVGAKKYQRHKKPSEMTSQQEQQLLERKQALEEEIAKENESLKALEDKANQLKEQLN